MFYSSANAISCYSFWTLVRRVEVFGHAGWMTPLLYSTISRFIHLTSSCFHFTYMLLQCVYYLPVFRSLLCHLCVFSTKYFHLYSLLHIRITCSTFSIVSFERDCIRFDARLSPTCQLVLPNAQRHSSVHAWHTFLLEYVRIPYPFVIPSCHELSRSQCPNVQPLTLTTTTPWLQVTTRLMVHLLYVLGTQISSCARMEGLGKLNIWMFLHPHASELNHCAHLRGSAKVLCQILTSRIILSWILPISTT